MISRWNATTWPPFRRLPFWAEPEKLSFVVFREREQQSMNHFNLHAASKLKFQIFYVRPASNKIKKKRMSYTNKKRKIGKFKFQQPSSSAFPS